jgi:hypothetical protein
MMVQTEDLSASFGLRAALKRRSETVDNHGLRLRHLTHE